VSGHFPSRVSRRRRAVVLVLLPLTVALLASYGWYGWRGSSVAAHSPTRMSPTTPSGLPAGATASPQTGCVALPHHCGYPDVTNTGVPEGTRLRAVPQEVDKGRGWHFDARGWVSVDGDGAVLEGLDIPYNVDVSAPNVTIRKVRIRYGGEGFGVSLRHTHDVTVTDSEISGLDTGAGRLMVGVKDIYGDSTGTRVLRSDISRVATGVQLDAGLVESNYIHDLGYVDGDHVNGVMSNSSSGALLTVRYNTVLNGFAQTDAVSLFQDFGGQRNRVITGNLLAGGGYTVYAGARSGGSATSDIRITGNRFSRLYHPNGGAFGPVTTYRAGPGNVWEDNIWDDTGAPVHH
jgi:hypothetical protein